MTMLGTVAILAQGTNLGYCDHASLLRNKGKTCAIVGIELSAVAVVGAHNPRVFVGGEG